MNLTTIRKLATDAKELAKKATPGDWKFAASLDKRRGYIYFDLGQSKIFICDYDPDGPEGNKHQKAENFQFIAASRTLVPDLAEALLRALDALERCREQREINYNGLNQNFHAERDDEELSSILFPQGRK